MTRLLARLLLATLFLSAGASAQVTTLWLQSDAGDYIGQGITSQFTAPTYPVTFSARPAGQLYAMVAGYYLNLKVPGNGPMLPGAYEGASRYPPQGTTPSLEFAGNGRGCNQVTGRFVVLEAVFNAQWEPLNLAIDFEQHCEGAGPALWGEFRYQSTVPLTKDKTQNSVDPFAFAPVARVPAGTSVTSASTTLYGLTEGTPFTIAGGEYSLNGTAFTSAPGVANNRDRLQVRTTASNAAGGTQSATVTILGYASTFVVTTYDPTIPFTALWFQSDAGDYVGGGQTMQLEPPNQVFSFYTRSDGLTVYTNSYYLDFQAPNGGALVPGAYEGAVRYPFQPSNVPGLSFSGNGRGCSQLTGRFVVLQAVYNTQGVPQSLAIDFEQHCEGAAPALWGELRYQTTVPLTKDKTQNSVDPFRFAPQVLLPAGTTVVSDQVTLYGLTAAAPFTIQGGEYSLNGGAFTSAPGTANNRDRIQLRAIASSSPGGVQSATVNILGYASSFQLTTYDPATPYTVLWFQSDAGDYLGQGRTNQFFSPTDVFSVSPRAPGGLLVSVGGYFLEVQPPTGSPLTPGAYEGAVRSPSTGTPGLNFSGPGRSCYQLTGRFVVLQAVYNGLGVPQNLAIDFEQHCDGGAPALWGELRYQSTVPMTRNKTQNSVDPFSFRPQNTVPPGTTVTSATVTLYGLTGPAPFTIEGGEYSLNGGPFTSAPGTANNRDRLQVRAIASSTPGGIQAATVSILGYASSFRITTYDPTVPLTALYFKSYPGDTVGGGQTLFARAPDWTVTFSGTASTPNYSVDLTGPNGRWYRLLLTSPDGAPLAVGAYEEAAITYYRGTSPGLEFKGGSSYCYRIEGRFAILQADFTDPMNVRFAANFEQWCDLSALPIIGEVRINSTIPPNFLVTTADSVPDPIAFNARKPVKAGSLVVSNYTRIYGVNAPVPVAIAGGEYSVNGAPYTSAPGTLYDLDELQVRVLASSSPGGVAQATLDAGGTTATFKVTTHVPSEPLSAIYFTSQPGDYIGGGQTRLLVSPTSIIRAERYGNGAQLSLTDPRGVGYNARFSGPGGTALVVGTYENASRSWTATSAGMDFTTDGRACNQQTGRFVVREVAYGSDGSVQRLAIDMEQHCDGAPAALFAELRFNSTVPITALHTPPPPVVARLRNDANGDGRSDVLWRDTTNGQVYQWQLNGAAVGGQGFLPAVPTNWTVGGMGDFNGDGRGDVFWRDGGGLNYAWLLDGLTVSSQGYLPSVPSSWSVAGIGDLDGDGRSDILWRNATSGQNYVWLMNGMEVTVQGYLPSVTGSGWIIAGVGDLDGDGRADILWRDEVTGANYAWLMQGLSITSQGFLPSVGAQWQVAAVLDSDGDLRSDVFWRNTSTGENYLWRMNGMAIASQGFLPTVADIAWVVAASGDYDGDGKGDVFWRHGTTGENYLWMLDGMSVRAQGPAPSVPGANWMPVK